MHSAARRFGGSGSSPRQGWPGAAPVHASASVVAMSDKKRGAFESIFEKFSKLLPLLGSDKAGEADAARAAMNRLLKRAEMDWHDVVTLLQAQEDPIRQLLGRLFEKEIDVLIRLGYAEATFFCSRDQ